MPSHYEQQQGFTMSLSKQLGIGFFCVVLLMFTGTLWTNTANTRNFIAQQLSSHAQDTATSLGLSVTPYIANKEDLPIVETMTNAIFDRGYYASIALTDLDGNVIIERSNPVAFEGVPVWFVSLFDIAPPSATSELNNGWTIMGKLTVTSNTGYAYQQLWANTMSSFWITFLVFGIALVFVWLLVKRVISAPINAVIEQTQAISQQQFDHTIALPKTVELRKIVSAINFMSNKLSSLFKQLSEQSEKYRQFAYTDPLTKAGNRRAYELYIGKLLRNDAEHNSGHLLLIRASSLAEVHKSYGGEIGDNYLIDICESSKKTIAGHFDHFSIYRINGADFGILIENTKTDDVVALAKALALNYKRMEKSEYSDGAAHIGVSAFSFNDELSQLMERADNALSVAKDNEKRWELAENLSLTHSNEVWRHKIEAIISAGTSDFAAQAIVDREQVVEYSEWFARLPNAENSANMPMAQLIPASIRLDHAQSLDRLIVSNLLTKLQSANARVGLNLSRLSIFDVEFMDWLLKQLAVAGEQCENLVVEISERALVHDIDALVAQTNRLKALGIKIAVEHFGAQLAGIRHLRKLKPDYLKLDGRFTRNIHNELDNQLFIHSLVNIAHGLHIKVIAEMIETEREKDWLMQAQVDYFQGYFIASPSPIAQ